MVYCFTLQVIQSTVLSLITLVRACVFYSGTRIFPFNNFFLQILIVFLICLIITLACFSGRSAIGATFGGTFTAF